MIYLYYGEDRLAIDRAVQQILGDNYELFDGDQLAATDLPHLFQGASLFADTRRVLVKDLQASTTAWAELPKYLDTDHTVIIWESKLDKRTVTYKTITKDRRVQIKEFASAAPVDKWLAFNVFDLAVAGKGQQAITRLDQSPQDQDPYLFFGSLIAAAIKAYEKNPSPRTARPLKTLAKSDLNLKTTGLDPWLLIKSCLLKLT